MPPEPTEQLTMSGSNLCARGFDCCGKPKGCTNLNEKCAYLQHPYKRWVRGEISLAELTDRLGLRALPADTIAPPPVDDLV